MPKKTDCNIDKGSIEYQYPRLIQFNAKFDKAYKAIFDKIGADFFDKLEYLHQNGLSNTHYFHRIKVYFDSVSPMMNPYLSADKLVRHLLDWSQIYKFSKNAYLYRKHGEDFLVKHCDQFYRACSEAINAMLSEWEKFCESVIVKPGWNGDLERLSDYVLIDQIKERIDDLNQEKSDLAAQLPNQKNAARANIDEKIKILHLLESGKNWAEIFETIKGRKPTKYENRSFMDDNVNPTKKLKEIAGSLL